MDENKETRNTKNSSYPYSEEPEDKHPGKPNGFANFSMTCGIMALLSLFCMMFPFSIIMGAGSFCFAILSKKEDKFSRPARAGMIMGGAAIIFAFMEFFYLLFLLQVVDDPMYMGMFNEMYDEMIQIQENILP